MQRILRCFIFLIATLTMVACTKDLSSDSYDEGVIGQEQRVQYGTIVDAEKVSVKGNSGVGGLAGAGVGAVGGSFIGGGRSSLLGTLGGAIVGGLAGNAIDKSVNSQTAVRYIIQLDQAQSMSNTDMVRGQGKASYSHIHQQVQAISIVQSLEKNKNIIPTGTRVMILGGGTDRARIVPLYDKA